MGKNRRDFGARGSSANPAGRLESLQLEPDPLETDHLRRTTKTAYLIDRSRSIITCNESPDVGFDASLNPYRGCEHGCAYCYARPFHEYLGFSAGLDFESRILVKQDAPALLRTELSDRRWRARVVALSGVTDPYQPVERRLRITRRCLEVLRDFRNPVDVITKNYLVTRDADLLTDLASHRAAAVTVSLATLDISLSRKLEPRTSTPDARLKAIRELRDAGVPCGVFVAPVIPGLTDHEIPRIVEAASKAGATFGTYCLLRLPYGVRDIFESWLQDHLPGHADKVTNRIRETREGRMNDSGFETRMSGTGAHALQIADLFRVSARRAGMHSGGPSLSVEAFRRPFGNQPSLFD